MSLPKEVDGKSQTHPFVKSSPKSHIMAILSKAITPYRFC